ncbi:hypothetical protein BH23BAC3_BH23BAC3_17470 [soil metagenome]
MPIHFINKQKELDSILPTLKNAVQLAIDLEFDKNYYRYGFNLCLVQIYDGNSCYLIDPLSDSLDIQTIFPVLENPDVQKVTFAFGEDLRLLHSMGCFPKNIYDVDNAISLLNYSPASLTNHLDNILEIDTGKSSQMSNWYKRPLSEQQIKYAAEDVLHLIKLQNVLADEAEQKKITGWINEENKILDSLDYSDVDNNDYIKEKDKNDFTEKEWYIYTRLMESREEIAEKLNKPSFQIIKKDVIKKIALDPDKLNKWTSTRGIFKRLRTESMKKKLYEVTQQALDEASELGLSDDELATKSLSDEEKNLYREQREKINRAKSEFFNPIKDQIEADYGKEVATFLFSNRIIAEIVTDNQTDLAAYKLNLLKRYSDDLDLDIEDYLNF